jgi:heme/copper-type cytochrome/quinol oxidase subunit 2
MKNQSDTVGTQVNVTLPPLLPREHKEQPAVFRETVMILFLFLALILCVLTCVRRHRERRRSNYDEIHSLVV